MNRSRQTKTIFSPEDKMSAPIPEPDDPTPIDPVTDPPIDPVSDPPIDPVQDVGGGMEGGG
jgi:hypothetical protein